MSKITEEMLDEYEKCSLYSDFIKEFNTAEKNMQSDFLDSVRCTGIYVPKPWDVAKEYRDKAMEAKIDQTWLDKFIPEELTQKG